MKSYIERLGTQLISVSTFLFRRTFGRYGARVTLMRACTTTWRVDSDHRTTAGLRRRRARWRCATCSRFFIVYDADTVGDWNGLPGIIGVSETGIHLSERTLVDADADAECGRVKVEVGCYSASRAIFGVVAVARSAFCRRADNGT